MNIEELDFTNAKLLRLKAEEKLKESQKKIDKPVIEADVQRLLHELQVHQIELEMQNEELQHTYETAELALKKYTLLYDLAPMGYFTLDSDGSICDLNYAGADMLGERHFSLINSNFKLFVADDSLQVFNNFFKKVHTSNMKESCQVKLGHNKEPSSTLYMEGVVTDEDHKCLLSIVDITNLQKMANL